MVYVDSGSTDGSVQMSRARGIEVVELDMSIAFTAARARNAGFAHLKQLSSPARWVQFIDGDCEVIEGWIEAAESLLEREAQVACVCGGLRERFPERSIYNRIADQPATLPSGPIAACGGIAMMRSEVFDEVGGFREDLFAGEEAELCLRMRNAGWKIWRLSIPMAWHDSAMFRFQQWWKRTKRVGYTQGQAANMYGRQDLNMVRQAVRSWVWAALIPLAIATGVFIIGSVALLALLVYPLQILRVANSMAGHRTHNLWSACFLMLGKFPELLGQCQYWIDRHAGVRGRSFHKS